MTAALSPLEIWSLHVALSEQCSVKNQVRVRNSCFCAAIITEGARASIALQEVSQVILHGYET
jgi:hypothetical protein